MRRFTTALFALVSFALIASACGGDDDGGDLSAGEQRLADAIAAQMVDDDDETFTQADAQCAAEGMVSEIGIDRLVELGLSQEAVEAGTGPEDVDLPDEVVDDFLDVFFDCVDFADVMVAGMTEDGDISEDSAKCLAKGFEDDLGDLLRDAARAGITGEEFDPSESPEFISTAVELMADCLTDEEFADIMG